MNLSFSKTLAAKAHVALLFLATAASSAHGGDICVAEDLAAASGWHLNWVVQVPFDTDRAELESLGIGDGMVVATSGDGRVHAYRESPTTLPGTLAWSQRIGHATEPGFTAQIGPSLVLATRGRNLYSFDRETGDRLWADHLGRMPNAPAVEGDNWVFVPFGPQQVLRLPAYPNGRTATMRRAAGPSGLEAEDVQRDDKALKTSALESQEPLPLVAGTHQAIAIHRINPYSVAWIGEEGVLVTLNMLENGWLRHEISLTSIAVGDLIHRDGAIWIALASGDVVRIDADQEAGLSVAWRAALPALPTGDLLSDGETLLVSLGSWGIEARDASTGKLRWKRSQSAQLLAIGGGMAWWLDATRRLVLCDLNDGQLLCTLDPGRFQMPIKNKTTDHLYLATAYGVIASLKPKTTTSSTNIPLNPAEQVPANASEQQYIDSSDTDDSREVTPGSTDSNRTEQQNNDIFTN